MVMVWKEVNMAYTLVEYEWNEQKAKRNQSEIRPEASRIQSGWPWRLVTRDKVGEASGIKDWRFNLSLAPLKGNVISAQSISQDKLCTSKVICYIKQ
jgi:hypothetical protein